MSKRCCAGMVFAIAIAAWGTSGPATAGVIGIDAVHGFGSDDILATGSDFDTFRTTITELGHTIVPMSSFEAEDLAGIDAVFLNQPYAQNGANYSASEINAILDFVMAGGGLVVTAENGRGFEFANINDLVAEYGITYADAPTSINGHTITGFVTHPVTAGLSSIGVDFQLPITTLAPSLDLTTGSGEDNVLSALGIPGTRAVFLSDTSQWSDEEAGSDRPITFGDNQLLLDNIVGYVPEPSAILLFASGLAVVARRRVERGN